MTAKLSNLTQVAVQAESGSGAEGTDPGSWTGSHVIPAGNVQFQYGVSMFDRSVRSTTFSKYKSVPGKRMGTLSFETELYGLDASDTALPWLTLLPALGLSENAGGNNFIYTPTATWNPLSASATVYSSLSMRANVDGRLRTITGARGNAVISFNAGQPAVVRWTFQGVLAAPSDTAFLSSASDPTAAKSPPIFSGATMSVGGLDAAELLVSSCEIDFGNVLTMRDDANASTGYRSCAIVDRNPVFRFDPEDVTLTEHDFYAVWAAATTGALSITLGSSNNKVIIAAPAVQYMDVQDGDRNGLFIKNVGAKLCRSSGNDEITITVGP